MTTEELQTELADVLTKLNEAKQWGAYVSALAERGQELVRALRAREVEVEDVLTYGESDGIQS